MHAHIHPLKAPPALRRPQAAAALSGLQLGVPGGTPIFVKLVLSAAVLTDTPVTLSTDDPTATLPAAVIVPAGAAFVRFTVQTSSPSDRRFLTIRATLAGVTRLQQITLIPASLPPLALGMVQATTGGLVIQGTGFGTAPGQVSNGGLPLAVLTWTPTAITTAAPAGPLGMLTVRRADGQWYSSAPVLLPAGRRGWPRLQ